MRRPADFSVCLPGSVWVLDLLCSVLPYGLLLEQPDSGGHLGTH